MTFRFRRAEHLKRRDTIRRAFSEGKKVSCPGAKLFYIKNEFDHNRIAFTFARKYGNAVQRNRSRRVSREAYRLLRNKLSAGYDLVLLVYPGKDRLDVRQEQLLILFGKAGLLLMETV